MVKKPASAPEAFRRLISKVADNAKRQSQMIDDLLREGFASSDGEYLAITQKGCDFLEKYMAENPDIEWPTKEEMLAILKSLN